MSSGVILASAADLTGRARLREAAVRLFAERGVAGASVRDIAEAAGVTAGLITHYFGSKEGLKAAVDEVMVQVFTEPLSMPLEGGPQERLIAISEALARTMTEHPELRAYLRRSFLENDPVSTAGNTATSFGPEVLPDKTGLKSSLRQRRCTFPATGPRVTVADL